MGEAAGAVLLAAGARREVEEAVAAAAVAMVEGGGGGRKQIRGSGGIETEAEVAARASAGYSRCRWVSASVFIIG